jgi:hypothetical protein
LVNTCIAELFFTFDVVFATLELILFIQKFLKIKTQHFGDWILSPSLGGTYSDEPDRELLSVSGACVL